MRSLFQKFLLAIGPHYIVPVPLDPENTTYDEWGWDCKTCQAQDDSIVFHSMSEAYDDAKKHHFWIRRLM